MSAGQGVGGRGSVCFVRRGLGGGGTRDRMLLALLAVLPPLVSVFGEIGAPCGGVGSKSLLLVVENPLDVSELADYAACDGIYINVTWANSVIIPKTIELGNGTSVNVRGEGEGAGALLAVVDGANKRGLFRVGPGATLELYNIQLRNGTVEGDGGCIHTQGGARVVCGKGCMMIGCRCMNAGGAVFLDGGSTLSMEDDASIMNSYSELKGGAIAAQERSSVVMSGTATVSWNQCVVDGGGLWLADESTLSMTESARISNNTIPVGGRGGGGAGIFGTGFSRIVMADYTSVSDNFIGGDGAGAYLQFNSSLSMHGHAQMARNYATAGSLGGGALSGVLGVTVTMHDDSSIVDNSARGSNGGAMYCWSNCSFTMADRTRVTGNIATNGGGFFLDYGSHLIMGGNSTISDNYPGAAQIYIESMVSLSGNAVMTRHQGSTLGGAVQAWSGSRIFLADNVQIIDNSAVYSGGGLFLSRGSLDASGNVTISGNSANSKGGGIYCAFCNISADGDFLVEDNSAGFGGGGMSLHLSTLRLSGHSILKANDAADVGGGLYATASDITLTDDVAIEDNFAGRSGGGAVLSGFSLINIKDRTRIMRNSAGTDGGGLSLVTSNVAIDGDTVSIFQNSAGNSGGGISMTMSSLQSKGHTVMAGNTAASSGGAIFMQRGVVEIQGDAVIRGNEADVGGGIFIGRESHLAVKDSGSFVENLARKGGGAIFTVSGAKLYLGNATLVSSNKAFRAGAGILHDSDATPDTIQISAQSVFEDNMSECCALQPPGRFPTTLVGKELSSCSDVDSMDNVIERVRGTYECCGLGEYPHPTSGACTKCQDAVDGIDCGSLASMLGVQVESLPLARGFWRATRSSLDIVKCRISGACAGGEGVGDADDYCAEGFTGPYCSVCKSGYARVGRQGCKNCSEHAASRAILAAVIFLAVALLLLWATIHFLSDPSAGKYDEGTGAVVWYREVWARLRFPLITFQIITTFVRITGVSYPKPYASFLSWVDVINLDLGWLIGTGCVVQLNFYGRLLLGTLIPMGLCALLALSWRWRMRSGLDDIQLAHWRSHHVQALVILFFLLYSTQSSLIFQTFACEEVAGTDMYYLRADLSISCDSPEYMYYRAYALVMVMVYPVGILSFFIWLVLWRDRQQLMDLKTIEDRLFHGSAQLKQSRFLWQAYRAECFFYEIIECCRRLLLTGVLVFFPAVELQIMFASIISFISLVVFALMDPLAFLMDKLIYCLGALLVLLSTLLAASVSIAAAGVDEGVAFSVTLVILGICIPILSLGQAFFVGAAVRSQASKGDKDGSALRISDLSTDSFEESYAGMGDINRILCSACAPSE